MTVAETVLKALKDMGIPFDVKEHPPAASIEDCLPIASSMNATVCRNYFLTTKSKKAHALLVTRPEAKLVTKDISKQAGTPRLMFADEDSLYTHLRTHPGAVSPLGLLFDEEKEVLLLMDSALKSLDRLAFHPCDNTMTVVMTASDFLDRFLPKTGHAPTFVEIHDFWDMI